MTDGLKASQIKGGIRPSKSFDQGRVCKDESCSTQLSIYNKRDHCFNHAPVKNPKTEVESEVTLKGLASFFG